MTNILDHLGCKERLRELGREDSGGHYSCILIHHWGSNEDRERLLSVLRGRRRGNGHKLKQRKFCLSLWEHFLIWATTKQSAQRCTGASILADSQNVTGHSLEQPALSDPALSIHLDENISRDASSLSHPVMLCAIQEIRQIRETDHSCKPNRHSNPLLQDGLSQSFY